MLRTWLVSALVVGVVAAVVIYWPDGSETNGEPVAATSRSPAPLSDWEVRTYLSVWPEVRNIMGRGANKLAEEWERTGKFPDNSELSLRIQADVDAVLLKHKLTRTKFQTLRSRISYAVDVVRYEATAKERAAAREADIRTQEALRKAVKDGSKAQQNIDAKIARLKAEADAPGPALDDDDRALLQRYWKQLEPAVPSSTPPKR